jgi:hypothetical protein
MLLTLLCIWTVNLAAETPIVDPAIQRGRCSFMTLSKQRLLRSGYIRCQQLQRKTREIQASTTVPAAHQSIGLRKMEHTCCEVQGIERAACLVLLLLQSHPCMEHKKD